MENNNSKQSKRSVIPAAACACLPAVIATLLLWPLIIRLAEPEGQQDFRNWVDSVGVAGWIVILGIQILQIIIAFIPGEPVEILAGMFFGTWGGLLLCMIGSVIASTAVFTLTRRFGLPLIYRLFSKEKVENFAFFRDSQKAETVAFLLFLIPGTPKDMLTYVAGVSKIKLSRFLLITTFARIPSIITGTIAGDALLENRKLSLSIFMFTGIVGLIGIRYKKKIENVIRIISLYRRRRNENKETKDITH